MIVPGAGEVVNRCGFMEGGRGEPPPVPRVGGRTGVRLRQRHRSVINTDDSRTFAFTRSPEKNIGNVAFFYTFRIAGISTIPRRLRSRGAEHWQVGCGRFDCAGLRIKGQTDGA